MRGGRISGLRTYLIRVESVLRPHSTDLDGSSLRDVAILLIQGIANEGVVQFERRIHRAANTHCAAETRWFELVEGFGRRAATTLERMHDASSGHLPKGCRIASSSAKAGVFPMIN